MVSQMVENIYLGELRANCEKCFGLCCVALPYAKSADFALNKDGGTPCTNLQENYRCKIHTNLRGEGFRGCSVYECFGAGQKVSQLIYKGRDWRQYPETAAEMFNVFPIMQQLHEMLLYLSEGLSRKEASSIHNDLRLAVQKTEELTNIDPKAILALDIPKHRAYVNQLLLKISEMVRATVKPGKKNLGIDLIGVKLKRLDLKGTSFRGALLIAADLREADLRMVDFIGADLRDADLRGADLTGSIFLTQAQINAARGDRYTKIPSQLQVPEHWMN